MISVKNQKPYEQGEMATGKYSGIFPEYEVGIRSNGLFIINPHTSG